MQSKTQQIFKKSKSKEKYNEQNKLQKNEMKEITSDPRFLHISSDPRYRNVSKKEIKINIDNRFKAALTNENFSTKPILDPRGRPKSYGTKGKLDKFYDLQSSEDDSDKDEEVQLRDDSIIEKESESASTVRPTKEEEATVSEKFMQCLLDPERDLARGEAFYSDDSSDDDSTTTDEDAADLGEFEWGELDREAVWDCDGNEVEETSRFAVCDMDWDKIKAVDLMSLFSSFVPLGGAVKRVTIYPSEYGKKRMKEEEVMGPQELVRLAAGNKKGHFDDYDDLDKIEKGTLDESTAASAHELEALRRYQRNRLRYYYAVVEFDSVETARLVYRECDRTHFEVAGVILDLRYIPSDMEFDEVPHDECRKIPEAYESSCFQATALMDSKPKLTWDETDERRKKTLSNIMTKALKKESFDEEALREYVACSDEDDDSYEDEEEEEEEEGDQEKGKEDRIAKFRALISEIEEKERKKQESAIDMEGTFDIEKSEPEKSDSESGSEISENEDNLTPFEKFLIKKKEKRKERIKKKKKMAKGDSDSEDDKSENDSDEGTKIGEKTLQSKSSSLNSEQQQSQKKGKLKKKGKRSKLHVNSLATIPSDLSLLVMDEEKEAKKHFDMRKIIEEKKKQSEAKLGKKRRKQEETPELNVTDNFKVDSSDPRFAALFSHRNFNLDPSHPKYDPHSTLNTFASQTPKKQKTQENADFQPQKVFKKENQKKSQLDPVVTNLVQKMKAKVSKFK